MNCPKCGKDLTPGAKFCGGCGTKIEAPAAGVKCPKCGKDLKPGAKFCGGCGMKIEAVQSAPAASAPSVGTAGEAIAANGLKPEPRPDVSLIDRYIHWNIQPGQVAIKIDEADIASYGRVDKIKGVHIQDGVKALLFAKGKFVTELSSGSYKFSDYIEKKAERVPPPPTTNNAEKDAEAKKGWLRRAWSSTFGFVSNLFGGEQRRRERAAAAGITAMVTNDVPRVSMVLIRSAEFPLVFNFSDVVTNPLRVNVGLHLLCKITNLNEFHTRIMSDRKYISFENLSQVFAANVDSEVRQALATVASDRVESAGGSLLAPLQRVVAGVYPFMSVSRILQFTTDSKELDGLRRLAEELYVSEKELEQVMRRNDFLNRYQAVRNAQELTELQASNAFDLEHGARTDEHELAMTRQGNAHALDMNAADHDLNLQRTRQDNAFAIQSGKDKNAFEAAKLEIYKEMSLTEDEQAKFDMMLSAERQLREAKSEDEVAAAMQEFEKSGMFRQRELAELRRQMAHEDELKEMQRDHAVSILSLQNSHAIEEQKLEWEIMMGDKRRQAEYARIREQDAFDLERLKAEHERARVQAAFDDEQRDKADAYADARRDKADAYADARQQHDDDYADVRREKDAAFADARRQSDADFAHAQRRADMDLDRQEQMNQSEALKMANAIRQERENAELAREMQRDSAEHARKMESERLAMEAEKQRLDAAREAQKDKLDAANEEKRIYAGMSFEQIMAANPNISEAAAQALAKKFEAETAAAQNDKTAELMRQQVEMANQNKGEMMSFMQQMMAQQNAMNMQQMQMMRDTSVANASAFAGMQQQMMGAKQAELDRAHADAAANNAMMLDGMKTTVGAMSGIVGAAAAHAAPVSPAPSAPVSSVAPVQAPVPAPQAKAMPPVAPHCPSCGAELESGAAFCGECGTSL